jgi:dihydrolipoamide dehydrogenase
VATSQDSDGRQLRADVAVLGAGPGGYSAAFRAADLGLEVVLVERYPVLGGVCLHVGCIPSKALLHVAEVMADARDLADHGVSFGEPTLDLARLRAFKGSVVKRLTDGLSSLAQRRRVTVVTGSGRFTGAHRLEVETADGSLALDFAHAIVAAGSRAAELPGLPADPRIMDSTDALTLHDVPSRLLVIGGGIIGLELAAVYDALGSEITVVELQDELLTGVDRDLVRPLERRLRQRYAGIFLGTRVAGMEPLKEGLRVSFEGAKAPEATVFDRVLVAVGRIPNGTLIAAESAGVQVDEHGFLPVDQMQRTNVAHIHAIGDVAGGPLLAHKAIHEGHTAAEVIAGLPAAFDRRAIPSVAYTDPEVAWTGVNEIEAAQQGLALRKGVFPWAASGRALGSGRSEGLTKLLFSEDSGRLVGAGIVGRHAGELIAELTHAIEMGSDAEDLALTIHAHPTLSESVGIAAEAALGTATDLPPAGAARGRRR